MRLIKFDGHGPFQGNSLSVERYDIPTRVSLENEPPRIDLVLQEDACSLLLLPRNDKYKTSVERIADALGTAGLSAELAATGLRRLIEQVAFSWRSAMVICTPRTLQLFDAFVPKCWVLRELCAPLSIRHYTICATHAWQYATMTLQFL